VRPFSLKAKSKEILVAADDSANVFSWRIASGRLCGTFRAATPTDARVTALAFDAAGQRLFAGMSDGVMCAHPLQTNSLVEPLLDLNDPPCFDGCRLIAQPRVELFGGDVPSRICNEPLGRDFLWEFAFI
jgi:hypothetical protein